jgi:nucleotide-binding universal stress UspA family protein
VTILHVVPEDLPPSQQRAAMRDATKALAAEVTLLRKSLPRGVGVTPLVRVGAVAKLIAASAVQAKAELIVMGRGGRRGLRETLLGSTAERVIRQARLPVLVVRLPPRAAYRRPALAVAIDQAAHGAVRLLLQVLPPPRPEVTVIHAYDFPYGGPAYPSLSHAGAEATKGVLRFNAIRDLAQVLSKALAKLHLRPDDAPSWKTRVHYGPVRLIVEMMVRKAESDLLVLGTRGLAGVKYAFLGTVAGDLLRQVKCDVLVVPPAARRR